jgi:hypothetical protein
VQVAFEAGQHVVSLVDTGLRAEGSAILNRLGTRLANGESAAWDEQTFSFLFGSQGSLERGVMVKGKRRLWLADSFTILTRTLVLRLGWAVSRWPVPRQHVPMLASLSPPAWTSESPHRFQCTVCPHHNLGAQTWSSEVSVDVVIGA